MDLVNIFWYTIHVDSVMVRNSNSRSTECDRAHNWKRL